ncbi:MAG: phosphoenolpyruvate--protein phosphotransferase [Spirochaetaceae bacterium]|jgi:phosphotransferase system enzyme I (PtsI)|nr:phosphoenolpyruvate--protein phosphotransferase [Spirochaetaceae bacterium]
MKKLTGIGVSPGIVIGEAFVHAEDDVPEIPRYAIRKHQVEAQWKRLLTAFGKAVEEVSSLQEQAEREVSREQADIFGAHLLMLEDPDFQSQIRERLESELENIEWVVWDISREMTQKLLGSPDAYLRDRAVDIADVSHRLLQHLLSVRRFSLSELTEDVILVVHDLLPSDVLTMNRERVKGIVMDMGGRTSHTAILARAFGIPAVLGLSSATKEITNGDGLVVNGAFGEVVVNPGEKVLGRYKQAAGQFRKMENELFALRDLPAETPDGHRVTLNANIELPEEAEQVLRYGAEGIGLYRSEFLFFTPGQGADEERQYRAYARVLKMMGDKPVTIRTVDVGGDKIVPAFGTGDEKNPLLGWRAIRFSLSLPELFKTQLRAILRASTEGNVRIMFPMISGIEELEQALGIWHEARDECRRHKVVFADHIEVGTMIEIPSAAMTADILSGRSDFFSIGTNDLLQYTLAVDRGNEKVNYLAQPFHPAMLRLLRIIIDAAHARGIRAAMCGELAGDPLATVLLLGLGLDEFSMAASAIPLVKRIIRRADFDGSRALAEKALGCGTYGEVNALLKTWMTEHFPPE